MATHSTRRTRRGNTTRGIQSRASRAAAFAAADSKATTRAGRQAALTYVGSLTHTEAI